MSDLDDEGFLIIKNALVQRNRRLVELNLDVTDITAKSMGALQDLLNKNLVLRLYLFKTKGISDNAENMKILTDCAKGNKFYISFVSAGNRQAINKFFDNLIEEQKDLSSTQDKNPTEVELKQMHDPLNNSFNKS
jgi:phosphatidylserine/phosphatidylglycerophosphate/cardiolipin synthase-like enzyme